MNDFFASLYELFGLAYIQNFSADMYTSNMYVTIGLILLLSSAILEAIYYYLLSNYGNLYKRSFWILWLFLIMLFNFSVAYYYSWTGLKKFYSLSGVMSPYAFNEHFTLSIINALWTLVFSFFFSIILKIKSIRASRTPF